LTINVVAQAHDPRKGAMSHGDELARAVHLDMVQAGWRPTAENYLGRAPKARILEAVREAKGESAAQLMEHLKKADMAREAERMLADTDRLPELLRLPGARLDDEAGEQEVPVAEAEDTEELPAFLADDSEASNELDAAEPGADETSDFAVAAE
jgi:ParB family chromosome partitioning protein